MPSSIVPPTTSPIASSSINLMTLLEAKSAISTGTPFSNLELASLLRPKVLEDFLIFA